MAGGLLGLAFAWSGLRGIDTLMAGLTGNVVKMDWVMVTTAILLALLSSLASGLYPTWRACNVAPAAQLKSS